MQSGSQFQLNTNGTLFLGNVTSTRTLGCRAHLSITNGTTINLTGSVSILVTRPLPSSTLFPYTTLFRSYLANNAVLTNSGTLDFQADGSSLYLNSAIGSISVI